MNDLILEITALILGLFCFIYSVTVRWRLYFPLSRSPIAVLRNQHPIFLLLLVTEIVSSAASAAGTIYASAGTRVAVSETLHGIFYLFHNLLPMVFALYILNLSGPVKKQSGLFFALFMLPCLAGEVLILTNPTHHLCFYVEETLIYHRGPALSILYAVAALYSLAGFMYFFRFSHSMPKADRAATIVLISVAFTGSIIQALWSARVELFFDAIAFMGFMAMLEHDEEASEGRMSSRFRASIMLAVITVFLAVISMNVTLIYNLTSVQSNEIGNIQLDIISRDLQDTISKAETNVLRTAIEAEQLLDTDPTRASLEEYMELQRQSLSSDKTFMNVYIAGGGWHIMPTFDPPPDYHATERVWYIGAKEHPGEVYITEPYIDANQGIMCFTVSTLLSDNDTVVAIDLNFSKAQESITRMTGDDGSTALIITSGGLIAGYTDMSLVGQSAEEKLPEYAEVIRRVTSSTEHGSFMVRLGGQRCIIFSSETSNGWYLIMSVETGMLYAESYRHMAMILALNLLLLVVVVVFYMVSSHNRELSAEAVKEQERKITALSDRLRKSVSTILRLSDWRLISDSESPAEVVGQIKESGLRLSEVMENLSSYSEMINKEPEKDRKRAKSGTFEAPSRRARNGVILVLLFALFLGLFLCVRSLNRWGGTSMEREADSYENQLNEWITQQQSILYMFTDMISAQPELMDDYDAAVTWLDEIASNYPEISVCYMTNPYAEYSIIMNNGWQPEGDFHLETRPWYRDTERSTTGFNISAPYMDAQTGNYCITFSRVVYGERNQFLGIFGIDFFLDKLINVLGESYTGTDYAFLVDSDSVIMNHPNAAYQMSDENSVSVEDTEYAEAYNREGVTFLRDYTGGYVACLRRPTQNGTTIMVVKGWWSVYGSMVLVSALFIFLFGLCIMFIVILINNLIRWQEDVNRQLVEAADAAVSAGKAKSQFLAQMSHEIRTPINAVLGMNELIMDTAREPEILEYAANIQSAGHTLLSLINSILDFSKIEDGKMEILNSHYKTLDTIDELVNLISERAVRKGLELNLDIDPNLPSTLYGDDLRIRQVMTNLLSNAVKYTPSGSITVTVRLNGIESDRCELYFAVTDTGIGIRDEDIGKLFESFRRLDEERNRSIMGTGLGIAIVQRLLVMMGTQLEVTSRYGKGSTFSFHLSQQVIDREPIGSYDEHSRTLILQKQSELTVYAPDADVLVVDDNDLNLKVAKGLLRRCGVEAALADSGEKCLKMAEAAHYDIIFMDHMMPVMDGIKTLEVLRRRGIVGDDTVIIVLTANAVVGARETYLTAGFRDYLSKPIEFDELQQMLARYLPEGKVCWQSADERVQTRMENADPIDRLTAAGFNTEAGLGYAAGDRSLYLALLTGFRDEYKARTAAISDAAARGDLHSYEIAVHALKSVARMIGADALSDMAFEQEKAAKKVDEGAVRLGVGDLAALYAETAEKIAAALGNVQETVEVDKPESEITENTLRRVLQEAAESLDSFEVEKCGELLKGVIDGRFRSQSLRTALEPVMKLLDDFEAEAAKEKIIELLNGI